MAKRTFDLQLAQSYYAKYEVKGTMFNYLSDNTWIPCDKTKRPTKVNYVYDESLDTFQGGFLSKTLDSKLPNKTICRIIYEGYEPLYDDKGRPTNHDVCVIANGTCTYYPNADYYVHDYNLVELMHIMKDVRMETLTFTSQDKISVKDPVSGNTVTYVKEPYNLYTIIERILKLTRTSTNLEDNSWWSKIQIMDEELLRASGIGVDDAFVENTLYDALFKIGHYIGRVPVLYLNKDYDPLVSGSKEFLLFFERKDGLGGPEITKEELFTKHKGWVESQVDGKDADTVVSDVRNMVSNRRCTYPSDGFYIYPTGEETLFTLEQNQTTPRKLVLPHKISEVITLEQIIVGYNVDSHNIVTSPYFPTLSIIKCFEYKNWILQQDKDDCAYFKEGENTIHFGKNFSITYVDNPLSGLVGEYSINEFLYRVNYYPMMDGKVVAKKGESTVYETTFNQVDNYIDASTYGNMLQEYINQNGQADITLRKRYGFTDDSNNYIDIPKPGSIVRWPNGDKYLITNLSFDADVNGYECVYQLNKDYVRRNAYTAASQRIRNEGLNADKIYERFTNLSEDIKVEMSHTSTKYVTNNTKYLVDKKLVLAGLIADQELIKNDYIQAAYIRFYSPVDLENNVTEQVTKYIMWNVIKSQMGKSIFLNTKFNNNLIATPKIIDTYISSFNAYQSQTNVTYANAFGNVDTVSIGFGKFEEVPSYEEVHFESTHPFIKFKNTYPQLTYSEFSQYYGSSVIKIPDLDYQKDLREIFNFTYQVNFIGARNTIITSDFVEHCGLLGERLDNKTFKIIILNDNELINDGDIVLASQINKVVDISTIQYYNGGSSIELALTSAQVGVGNKMYALAYENSTGVYKPLLINRFGINSVTSIYIHV